MAEQENKKHEIRTLFWQDIRKGIRKDIVWFLPVFVFAIVSATEYHRVLALDSEWLGISEGSGILDYLIYCFRGAGPYMPSTANLPDLPIEWLLIFIYFAFLAGKYPAMDLKISGKNMLVRLDKKNNWWLGKCLYCIFSATLFYAVILGVLSIASICYGDIAASENLAEETIVSKNYVISCFISPWLTLISIGLIENLVSVLYKPIFGILCIIVILIISVFWMSPWAIGNLAMLSRNGYIEESGIFLEEIVGINLIVSLGCVGLGSYIFKKKNIY